MIRPQRKKQNKKKEFESTLSRWWNHHQSGLHGKVSELAGLAVVVETMSEENWNGAFCDF
jgi:preprotein translocase subunit YajC